MRIIKKKLKSNWKHHKKTKFNTRIIRFLQQTLPILDLFILGPWWFSKLIWIKSKFVEGSRNLISEQNKTTVKKTFHLSGSTFDFNNFNASTNVSKMKRPKMSATSANVSIHLQCEFFVCRMFSLYFERSYRC